MTVSVGIGLAFVAMLCWGFGDFLIQKSTRKIGDFKTLFIICGFGAVILLPFVWRDIPATLANSKGLWILFAGGIILFLAAMLDFEALKKGKLAIVEPIWSLEAGFGVTRLLHSWRAGRLVADYPDCDSSHKSYSHVIS